MKAVSFFRKSGTTVADLRSGQCFQSVTVLRGNCVVEIVPFMNLAVRDAHRRLRAHLVSATRLIDQGELDVVFYSLPFRLTGWTWHEWLYWLLILPFQLVINRLGIYRRIQFVDEHKIPESISTIDAMDHMRRYWSNAFAALTRVAVAELFPYFRRPRRTSDKELQFFLDKGMSICMPDDERRWPWAEAHIEALMAFVDQHPNARVRIYLPIGTAIDLRNHLLFERGFTIYPYWIDSTN